MYYLGIDTSNYTTSVAVVDENNSIIENRRIILSVDDRAKGLRQSEALFQHWNNLPNLLQPVLSCYNKQIKAVCVSTRPRPYDDSYMPVFTAGQNMAKVIADSLECNYFETSHQEGHFKAAALCNNITFKEKTLCAHLSGGTLELVCVSPDEYTIVGGTKDISYGKLLDRIGVDLGFQFPAGAMIDKLACEYSPGKEKNPFCKIYIDKTYTNLSGIETQLNQAVSSLTKEQIAYFMMERVAESFVSIIKEAIAECSAEKVLVSGGIAASKFLRKYCETQNYVFGSAELCSDNAVGVAALKGKKLWE